MGFPALATCLSCASAQSRNFAYGLALGRGESSLEGRPARRRASRLQASRRRSPAERDIEAPIISAVAAILAGKITINEAVSALMSRPLRAEAELISGKRGVLIMLFALICKDKADHLPVRLDNRPDACRVPAEAERGRDAEDRRPFLDDDGKPYGSLVVVEAKAKN